MTDYIIIVLLFLIWFQGTKWSLALSKWWIATMNKRGKK